LEMVRLCSKERSSEFLKQNTKLSRERDTS
jgi:hypothetical protein